VAGLDDESDGAAAIVPYAHHLLNAFAGLDWAVPLGVRPFADGPNVTALVGAVDVGPDGEPILNSALDIWHRSYAAAPVAGIVFEGDPATIPGVLAYVTERMMAGHGLPGGEPFGSVGVGEVFETSLSGGVPVRAVTSTSDLDALVVAPPARRRLEAGIARGLIAIVPAESVSIDGRQRTGWWLVDPATGRVADQMDDGKGAVSETSLLLRVVAIFGAGALLGWIAKAIKEAWCSKAWSDVTNKLDSELRF